MGIGLGTGFPICDAQKLSLLKHFVIVCSAKYSNCNKGVSVALKQKITKNCELCFKIREMLFDWCVLLHIWFGVVGWCVLCVLWF